MLICWQRVLLGFCGLFSCPEYVYFTLILKGHFPWVEGLGSFPLSLCPPPLCLALPLSSFLSNLLPSVLYIRSFSSMPLPCFTSSDSSDEMHVRAAHCALRHLSSSILLLFLSLFSTIDSFFCFTYNLSPQLCSNCG